MAIFDAFRRFLRRPDIIEKAANARSWTASSLSPMEKRHDGKPTPFSQPLAVRYYASWIYAASNINANAVASTPLRLFIRGKDGRKGLWKTRPASRDQIKHLVGDGRQQPSLSVMRKAAEIGSDFEEVLDNHPLLELMARSNPFINGYDLTVLRTLWQELTGNAYLHIVVNPNIGVPSELWPMPPQWTEVIPDERDFVAGYRYGRMSDNKVEFKPTEVIHFKRPNPSDLHYGMGKLQAAWGAAEANRALHAMDLSFFENKARPDYALIVKGMASQDELDALEAQIKSKLRGADKTGQFLVTTADLDLKPLQFPSKDLAGREDIVEEIAAVFGVPVSMLKANDPNLASAQTGFAAWREMSILPLCRMDEETLNQRLLPLFGIEGDAVLAYDNPVPKNRQQDLVEQQSAVSGGWMTPNEARELHGLDRIEDPEADKLHVGAAPLGGQPTQPAGGLGGPLGGLGGGEAPAPQPKPEGGPAAPVAGGTETKCGDGGGDGAVLDAQKVKAASDLLERLKGGSLAAPAATELLVALGFARPTAESMVGCQCNPVQQAAEDDCVSRKVRTLLEEGYPQEQAVAIAISMCGEGKTDTVQKGGDEVCTECGDDLATEGYELCTECLTKTKAGDNCGTGAGGFQAGNDCGGRRGGGGGKDKPSRSRKPKREAEPRGGFSGEAVALMEDAPIEKAGSAAWRKAAALAYETDPQFKAFVDGVTFFTQSGHTEIQQAVRSIAKGAKGNGMPIESMLNPMASYEDMIEGQDFGSTKIGAAARAITKAIETSPPQPREIFRGISYRGGKDGVAIGKWLAEIKKGDAFTLDVPTSFTADEKVADEFSQGIGGKSGESRQRARRDPRQGIVLKVKEGARGVAVTALSPWKQREILSQGKFKVVSVEGERPQQVQVPIYDYDFKPTGEMETRYMFSDRSGGRKMTITLEAQ